MAEDIIFGAKLVPDVDQLQDDIEDGKYTATVDLESSGGGRKSSRDTAGPDMDMDEFGDMSVEGMDDVTGLLSDISATMAGFVGGQAITGGFGQKTGTVEMSLSDMTSPSTADEIAGQAAEKAGVSTTEAMSGAAGSAGAGAAAGGGGSGIASMLSTIGSTLASISTVVLGILAFVVLLAMLEPIQETVGLIMRMLEIGVLPFIAILMALLRPFIKQFLRFIPTILDWVRDFSLGEFINSIVEGFNRIISSVLDVNVVSGIRDVFSEFFDVGDNGAGPVQKTAGGVAGSSILGTIFPGIGNIAGGKIGSWLVGGGGNQNQQGVTNNVQVDDTSNTTNGVITDLSDEAKKEETGNWMENALDDLF